MLPQENPGSQGPGQTGGKPDKTPGRGNQPDQGSGGQVAGGPAGGFFCRDIDKQLPQIALAQGKLK